MIALAQLQNRLVSKDELISRIWPGVLVGDISPYFVNIPETLKSVSFIETGHEAIPERGFACHSKVRHRDYIFTAYPKR